MELDAHSIELIQRIVIFFPCFLLALTFHEFSHAWMASKFGDQTAAWQGRLTLNPLAHIDPLGTIIFPLVNIIYGTPFPGWAKPVPTDSRNYSQYRKGVFWVAAAGPLSNILLGIVAAALYVMVIKFIPHGSSYFKPAYEAAQNFLLMNFLLAVFNLIPIPPLDGSHMLLSFLSWNAQRQLYGFWQYSTYILFGLMMLGFFRFVIIPAEFLCRYSVSLFAALFGLA